MRHQYREELEKLKKRLDKVSPGFCVLKWHYQQLYLHLGDTHSCFLPTPHPIPTDDLEKRPDTLHNTPWKMEQRRVMMAGGRPEECSQCWQAEDSGNIERSSRLIHHYNDLEQDSFEEAIFTGGLKPVNPRFLEISFGNKCNLKCGYCCPEFSSAWVSEVEEFGRYDISHDQYDPSFIDSGRYYEPGKQNPYVEAFWRWWPDLSKDLKTIRLTGGEPLLDENIYRLVDSIEDNPCPQLDIQLITNLSVSNRSVQRLTGTLSRLMKDEKIKSFNFFVSLENWGAQAEYVRYGIDLELLEKNLETIFSSLPTSKIEFKSTFHVLCVPGTILFLKKIDEWRKKYEEQGEGKIKYTWSEAWNPPHFKASILPDDFQSHFDNVTEYLKGNSRFTFHEVEEWTRVRNQYPMQNMNEEELLSARKDFSKFFTEYDRRRGLNFNEAFPEHKKFKAYCDSLID